MRKKELVLLMTALTKGGKTTIAMALCHPNYRGKMVSLSNCRTEVTVDWTYDPGASDITLEEILLNYQGVFGTELKERISCEKFSEVLDSEEGKYLRDTFGIEKQENLSGSELENYVLNKIAEYVNDCDDKGLAKLIRSRLSNRFLRRIKVVVPPVEEFVEFFNEKKVSLVLRDTRGLLDIDPEEATKVPFRTMQELGIDGIDAVLLLGTAAPFADTIKWYKKAYKSAFESVPVFIMTRPDAVSMLYRFKYGNNVTVENVHDFLLAAKKGNEIGFDEFPNTFLQCYRLLEMFELGRIEGVDFNYNYKVYNNEDLRYVYPNSTTLVQSAGSPDYQSADYQLYELIVFENLKDMINKVVEHNCFIEAIYNQIKTDFAQILQSNVSVDMYPDYRKYDRRAVCTSILSGSILGPRDGVVTTEHGEVKYLGAVTSGVSAREWLRNNVYSYKYSGVLKNPDGSDMVPSMPKDCRDNLVRMALFNIIEKNTDYQAYFQGYYFINRYSVRDAILSVRNNNIQGDALNNVSKEIAGRVF
ncbi:MAG: hypothetical protein IJD31_09480 [Lachnospiraceae bacterium]|nr:hypothetical protein [Lachnospiraceae bacterium]